MNRLRVRSPLEIQDRFLIEPEFPYSLALTAERFSRFPEIVDRFDGETYRRLIPVGRGFVLMCVRQPRSRAALEVRLTTRAVARKQARGAARRLIERTLGIRQNVRPFYRAFRADPLLGVPIRDFRGLRVAGTGCLWEALVTAILAQQINLAFAYDIRRHLALAFGSKARLDGETFVAFPTPGAIAVRSSSSLRRFRLSRAKARAIVGVARAFADGSLDEGKVAKLSDEEAIERMTAIAGVGRWTAEIALLRGLGRLDVFPAADLGVVKYLALGLLGRPVRASEAEMRKYSERWRPYRGLALVYAYAELARRKKEGAA